MNALTRRAARPEALDQPSWNDYLKARVQLDWRPGEFDSRTLVYIPDVDEPGSSVKLCARPGCGVLLDRGQLCPSCRTAWVKGSERAAGLSYEDWIRTPRARANTREGCQVPACPRSHSARGLCRTHRANFRYFRDTQSDAGLTVSEWIRAARPSALPPVESCLICSSDRSHSSGFCGTHHDRFRSWSSRQDDPTRRNIEEFLDRGVEPMMDAASQTTYGERAATPFGLLREPLRWELLYAVQQRDFFGRAKMTPVDVRMVYLRLRRRGETTVIGKTALGHPTGGDRNTRGFLQDLQWHVDEAHRAWSGIDNRDPAVIYFRDLMLRHSVKPTGRNARLDLRAIRQPWLQQTIAAWARAEARGPAALTQMQATWNVASGALEARGTPKPGLGRADVDAMVKAICQRWPVHNRQRRGIRDLSLILQFGRTDPSVAEYWADIPDSFIVETQRHRPTATPDKSRANDDEPFRFVPQPIVDWVMDHLHLVDRGDRYRTAEARAMIFVQERCGRRTGETTRLEEDCISYDDSGAPYLEWKEGKPPYGRGRRLPIHQETHDVIRDWQAIKREHGVESKWLFPSQAYRTDRHYVSGYLGTRIREFVIQIATEAPYPAAVEGADGNLIHFDIASIDPYSFRHAFAQRLADATDADGRSTTPPDVLQDYMGHRNFNTTMAYYQVTARRRKRALAAIPPRRLNLRGEAVPVDRERDGFGKIAVSLGSCTEPQNVAANGHSCTLNHACESCPFFLVDPFERDGIVAKRQHLRVQRERAKVINAPWHMVDHYEARIEDCTNIIDGIDKYIATLEPAEAQAIRAALEQMEDIRRRATAPRRIDLRELLGAHT